MRKRKYDAELIIKIVKGHIEEGLSSRQLSVQYNIHHGIIEEWIVQYNGYTTKVTEPVALNVWAYFRQLSGKEILAAAAYRYDEEVLFTINYRAGLTTACYVEYNGVKYSVTRIDTFEGYKQDITLYCKRQ